MRNFPFPMLPGGWPYAAGRLGYPTDLIKLHRGLVAIPIAPPLRTAVFV